MFKFVMEEIKYVICMNLSKCQVGNFPHFPVFKRRAPLIMEGKKHKSLVSLDPPPVCPWEWVLLMRCVMNSKAESELQSTPSSCSSEPFPNLL